ncbi:DNA mismatch repair protein Msh6 isoform X2 [Rhodnius prolixus]|uniref:DNA mismatch repair protein Msh6 isoform X2 n=1 Tax=Rhodnius prolixus TaxID=13249 RepID=UPI003D18D64E
MSQKNTLFKYFTPSPTAPKTPKNDAKNAMSLSRSKSESKSEFKKTLCDKSPNDRLNSAAKSKKSEKSAKKQLITSDEENKDPLNESDDTLIETLPELEDSGDEYVPDEKEEESEESCDSGATEETATDEDSPVKQNTRKRKRSSTSLIPSKKKSVLERTIPVKTNQTVAPTNLSQLNEITNVSDKEGNWAHLKYDFLKPEKIKDGKGRRPNHPEYDARTLYVPDDFLRNQTPAMRQWWEMKSKNFDSILFFKLGKFYELYHMDAMVGTKELSVAYMKGDLAHCGFPEIAYGRFASNLVDKGYKVARVEQTETPEMMTERTKQMHKATKFDKVVRREICQVTTKGTRIFTVAEGDAEDASSKYLLAIVEKELDAVRSSYGVCFIDTSIGIFHIGQFEDDRNSSRLRTLFAVYPPVQILYERNGLTKRTHQILSTSVSNALKEQLSPVIEFWTTSDTLTKLNERNYFTDGKLPETLRSFIGEVDSLGLIASSESEMGVKALGAIIWYLTQSLIDYQLVSLGQFEVYIPIDVPPENSENVSEIRVKNMVLDAVTLKNLNVLDNGSGGRQGTLLHRIEHCCTAFGKRLLHQWICSPLTKIRSIEARQEAVRVLRENQSILSKASDLLYKVPDLERLFSRIYAQSSKGLEESHPENRAIFFEEKVYSKRKIAEFISVLNGFQKLQEVVELFQEFDFHEESKLLSRCVKFKTYSKSGNFPDLTEHLKFFRTAFDHEEAEKEGRIIPSVGVDSEYDAAIEELSEIEKDLKVYLKSQCEYFGCKVSYVGSDKKRYQLEIPDNAVKKVGSSYEFQGQRKGFKKYYTIETKSLLERQLQGEERKRQALQNLRKRIFSKFSERNEDWNQAIECVAILDILMGLAKYSLSIEGDICTPVFKNISSSCKPYLKLVNGKYPCISGEDNFIPNDTHVGGEVASVMLLTGPNMGGKSTLMRQLGLIIIMAQLGSFVPAESLELTVVDRIFTRIGANDDIMSGESTFYLEMSETSAILHQATSHSLVLIDELGKELYNTFTFAEVENENYDVALVKFEQYVEPQKNLVLGSFLFNSFKKKMKLLTLVTERTIVNINNLQTGWLWKELFKVREVRLREAFLREKVLPRQKALENWTNS